MLPPMRTGSGFFGSGGRKSLTPELRSPLPTPRIPEVPELTGTPGGTGPYDVGFGTSIVTGSTGGAGGAALGFTVGTGVVTLGGGAGIAGIAGGGRVNVSLFAYTT